MNEKKNNSDPEMLIKQLNQTMLEMRQAVARLRVCAERSNTALIIQAQQDKVKVIGSPKRSSSTAKNDCEIILH